MAKEFDPASWKLSSDERVSKNLRKIEIIRAELREAADAGAMFDHSADFLIDAFHKFLSGKAATLDDAFGVRRGRGRPKPPPPQELVDLAGKIIMARSPTPIGPNPKRRQTPWKDLEEQLGYDARVLRDIAERHGKAWTEKLADKVVKRLEAGDALKKREGN